MFDFPLEIVFGVTNLAFRKCKKDCTHCNILKVILVQDFCPSKTEIARFLIGYRLNTMFRRDCQKTITFSNAVLDELGLTFSFPEAALPLISNKNRDL